jgi:hypothetical protein
VAVDLPGHGRSAAPALASVEAMAAWLLALLDTAGDTARNDEQAAIDMVNVWAHASLAHKPPCQAPGVCLMGTAQVLTSAVALRNVKQTMVGACDVLTIEGHLDDA